MRSLQVSNADARQRGVGHFIAIRVLAIDGFCIGTANHAGGPGVGLLERGLQALAFTHPDSFGIGRLGDLARGQRHGLVEQGRVGQRAQ